jgi:hypothetical protein
MKNFWVYYTVHGGDMKWQENQYWLCGGGISRCSK